MLLKYDVREHPAELEVYAYHWLTLTIGKYKYAPLPRTVGRRYVTEYRYTRAKIVDFYIENDFKFFNFLLSAFKLYERRKLIVDDFGPRYSYDDKYTEKSYTFSIRILKKCNRSKGLYLQFYDIDDDYKVELDSFEIQQLQNALIKCMNWMSPELSVVEEGMTF